MFRKFNLKEDVSGQSQLKSSVQRGLRQKLLDEYPRLESVIDELWPKKATVLQLKCQDHVSLFVINGQILFFNHYDGPIYPTLKVLHKYPGFLPEVQVDRGAIKFVLSGANIMCPGLTSKGAKMDDVAIDKVVAIRAEGKEHAVAIGYTKMSTKDIASINKGIGVDNIHFLNDALWTSPTEI
ncbi:hypothetical protein CONCODRAFT_78353 [Conidiobolus coronatus NRRL 28638]|uniref:Translation machinery-associated protein 20 n=1 Tax=Conidiobolus coronatus (strain ATCC 28846 / CBS 209.66 / NRRL 28638) TaxID=796925 RepID=A0A137P930_CONC2|nr:hypothetical protein CONCODRAFT_78353 [Conidiobolus coronatus NRRL 28638]|eukprot:KXN71454.1 hypothetical protein CONCODRAFT_78353 [Conidiobolus coronatus NRRL 28638]